MILELIKTNKEKKKGKKDSDLYAAGWYTGGGIITGYLIGELYDQLKLPGYNQKITHALITGQEIKNNNGVEVEKFLMTLLSTGLMFLEMFGVKGAAASGGGMLLGYTYATASKQGKYIGQV